MHAYFNCFSGISGDMTLGAFIDLGVPVEWLKEALSAVIPQTDFDVVVSSVAKMGIHARKVDVISKDDHTHRDYAAIKALIADSDLPERSKSSSLGIFDWIARAESKIHGCDIDAVHFHEVGAIDAIVDIAGTALCLDYLGIDTIDASALPLGSGFVDCSHGRLPVPAPATVEILKDVPVYGTDVPHELVTPTGAAIIKTLARRFGPMPDMVVQNTGYGAGSRNLETMPNLLRISLGTFGETTQDVTDEKLVLAETCIDDMNPELFGFLMSRLFEDGALDVYWIPVYMKKNRPGTLVHVLCPPESREKIVTRILTESTSTGVRWHDVNRRALPRRQRDVETSYGSVTVKEIIRPDGRISMVPEFDVCNAIAVERNIPLKVVYDTIAKQAAEAADK